MAEHELIRKAYSWVINQLKDCRTFEERRLIDFDTPNSNGRDIYSVPNGQQEETKYINVSAAMDDTLRFVICLLMREIPHFLPSYKFEGNESYLQFASHADWSKNRERYAPMYDLLELSIHSPMLTSEVEKLESDAVPVLPAHRKLYEEELRKCLRELAEDTFQYYLEPINKLGNN